MIVQANSCDHNEYKNYLNILMLSSQLQWLEETFLPYLEEWEASVARREGFSKAEKKRMQFSDETLLGLKMTGMSKYF